MPDFCVQIIRTFISGFAALITDFSALIPKFESLLSGFTALLPGLTALVATILATTIPVHTKRIDNEHQATLKKMELQQSLYKEKYVHMREVFEDYLQATSAVIHASHPDPDTMLKYEFAYSKAVLMVSEKSAGFMNELNNCIKQIQHGETPHQYTEPYFHADPQINSFFTKIRRSLQNDLAEACEKLDI